MISTMSERATTSSMKGWGMRPVMDRARSTAELGFDLGAHRAHIGPALRLRLDRGHDLSHVLDAARAGRGDGVGDEGVDLGVAELGGQVGLEQLDLRRFLVDQVLAVARLELHQGFLALLDHFLEDGDHLGIVQADALIHFALLDGCGDHADDAQPLLLAGAHRGFHVIGDALFQRHRGSRRLLIGTGRAGRGSTRRRTATGAAHVLAGQALQVALHRGGLLALTLLRRLLVEFAAAKLGEDTGLLACALETAQGRIETLAPANSNARPSDLNLRTMKARRHSPTGSRILRSALAKGKTGAFWLPTPHSGALYIHARNR